MDNTSYSYSYSNCVPLSADEEEVVTDPPEEADRLDPLGTLSEDDPEFVLQTEDGGRFYMDKNVHDALF